MQVLERNKRDVEAKAEKMSDFLKMEYLESCLKTNPDIETTKYCCKRLSELYENKIMYSDAVKYISKLQGVCNTPREKIDAAVKEAELLVKGGLYENAEMVYKKAISLAEGSERFEIKRKMIAFYKQEAEKLEKSNRSTAALKIYEKLSTYMVDAEKVMIRKKILELYQRLGKVKEYIQLKSDMDKGR